MTAIRSLISLPLVLLLAAAIHVDWHLARPQHIPLSLGWPYHWLLGVLVFGVAAWFVATKRPARPWLAGALNVAAAVLAGQVLEPLGEVVFYGLSPARLLDGARWTAFAQFIGAGIATFMTVLWMLLARSHAGTVGSRRPPA